MSLQITSVFVWLREFTIVPGNGRRPDSYVKAYPMETWQLYKPQNRTVIYADAVAVIKRLAFFHTEGLEEKILQRLNIICHFCSSSQRV